MKKYTVKYYDKHGNLEGRVKFWRHTKEQAEQAALKYMDEHHAFIVFRKGRIIFRCYSGFCEVMQLPVKRIIRQTKRGATFGEIYNGEWSMAPVSGKGILELTNNPN